MIGSIYSIIMGPTTLESPMEMLNFKNFSILYFIIGGIIIIGLEYLKKIGKENVEVVLNENENLTKMHDIAGQIEEMKERKIWLKWV